MDTALVTEYVDLRSQIAAEALFAEEVEQRYYDRLDQLWYVEMTDAERDEAQRQLNSLVAKDLRDERRAEDP